MTSFFSFYSTVIILFGKCLVLGGRISLPHWRSVDDDLAFEVPVPTVLAVSVAQLEQFNIGRIPEKGFRKEMLIVLEVPGIHAKAKRTVHLLERRNSLTHEVDHSDTFRRCASVKALDPVRVVLLGHPIKTSLEDVGRLAVSDSVAVSAFDAGDLQKSHSLAD